MKYDFCKMTEWEKQFYIKMFMKISKEDQDSIIKKNNTEGLDITVIANGVELDFSILIKFLLDVFDNEANEKAQKIIHEKLQEVFYNIEQYDKMKKELEKKLCEECGIPYKEPDEW